MTVLVKPEEGWLTGGEIKLEGAGFDCASTKPEIPGFEPVLSGSCAEESLEGDAWVELGGVWPLWGAPGLWLSTEGPWRKKINHFMELLGKRIIVSWKVLQFNKKLGHIQNSRLIKLEYLSCLLFNKWRSYPTSQPLLLIGFKRQLFWLCHAHQFSNLLEAGNWALNYFPFSLPCYTHDGFYQE